MASPTSEKRCLYEVLGLRLDCTQDEIRSAYKKLALQRHPDKLVQSGLSSADATASFQELVNAYEVLSDPRERSWYDSHRSQILFSNSNPSNSSSSVVPDLFSFFSNSVFSGFTDSPKGFYNVYGGIFGKIYSNELNFAKKLGLGLDAVKEAPVMGNLESPYAQVTAFYGYWLGFVTVMDFCWVDQYDAMAGVNRKSRRVMEEENKKLRKKARREYNETVRGLAEFVKKRDKRVIDMGVRKSEEMERKREEERERKREAEREKMERARAYREPEWAKVEEEDGEVVDDFDDNEEDEKRKKELYCVACGKKFKSEKQWKNHEQSKKHKEKVAELSEAFGDEERGEEEEEEGRQEGIVDDGIDELKDQFGGSFQVSKKNSDHVEAQSSEEEERNDVVDDNGGSKGMGESFGEKDDDDEASVLEAMLSGHKNKSSNSVHKFKAKDLSTNDGGGSDDETDFREYNNTKGARRKRGARRERGRRYDEEATAADRAETSDQFVENDGRDEGSEKDGTSFPTNVENESNGKGDDLFEKGRKVSKQPVDKKDNAKKEAKLKKDANANSKNASKGRKQKATTKASGTVCDTCGEDFESRNRLHKHLGDTGHASLKSR